jgi:hypothetical protein
MMTRKKRRKRNTGRRLNRSQSLRAAIHPKRRKMKKKIKST